MKKAPLRELFLDFNLLLYFYTKLHKTYTIKIIQTTKVTL